MEQAALFCSSPEKQQLSIYKFSHRLNRTSFCNCQCWRTGILLQGTWNGISASVHTQFPWTALLLSQSNLGHDDSLWMLSKKHPTACSVLSSQGRYSLLFSRDTHQFVPSTAPGSFSLRACHGNSDSVLSWSFPHLFCLRPSVAEVKRNLQANYASCWFQPKLTNSFLEPANLFTTTFGQKISDPSKNTYSLKQKWKLLAEVWGFFLNKAKIKL